MEKSRSFRIIAIVFVAAWLGSAAYIQASPSSLSYSTYFGGSGSDVVMAAAVDAEGNLFLAGYTNSRDLPAAEQTFERVTASACGSSSDAGSCFDIFVAKLDPTGQRLLSVALLGGSGDDFATSIAIDGEGNATIAGYTNSRDFPVLNSSRSIAGESSCGSAQQFQPCFDAFVARLNAKGAAWTYILTLGGSGDDLANGIAVDAGGNVAVVGTTTSLDFPAFGEDPEQWHGGTTDAFLARIDPVGRILFASSFGGSGDDFATSVTLSAAGNIYFAGYSNSADFWFHPGPQPVFSGGTCGAMDRLFPCYDAFVARLSPDASQMELLNFLGGTGSDYANAIVIDSTEGITIVGTTTSSDFPTTEDAPQTTGGGSSTDAFVARLDAVGTRLVYSTYLGGEGADSADSVVVDALGRTRVLGTTWGASLKSAGIGPGGFYDTFLTVIGSDGTAFTDAIRVGGTSHDKARALAFDRYDNAYIIAQTFSADYPVTRALQSNYGGGGFDAAITRIALSDLPVAYVHPLQIDFGPHPVSTRSSARLVRVANIGGGTLTFDSVTTSGDFEVSGGCAALEPGAACDWVVIFVPTADGLRAGSLTFMRDGARNGLAVGLQGLGRAPEIQLSKDSVVFDPQLVGTESEPQEITLLNAGTAVLDLSGIHVTGDFIQSNNCPANISVGESCTIQIIFRPSSAGSREGTLVVTNHLPEEMRQTGLIGHGSDFLLKSVGPPVTIAAGQSASLDFAVAPVAGFGGPLEFSCAMDLPAAHCSPSPRQAVLDGLESITVRVSVTTTTRGLGGPGRRPPWGLILTVAILLAGMLLLLGDWHERAPIALRPAFVRAALIALLMGITSCGSGGSPSRAPSSDPGTPPGSYLVSLTARSGAVSRTVSTPLIVQ